MHYSVYKVVRLLRRHYAEAARRSPTTKTLSRLNAAETLCDRFSSDWIELDLPLIHTMMVVEKAYYPGESSAEQYRSTTATWNQWIARAGLKGELRRTGLHRYGRTKPHAQLELTRFYELLSVLELFPRKER